MKVCKQCGAQVQDNASFCTKCGAKIEQAEAGGQTGQQANQQMGQQPGGMNQNVYMNQGGYQQQYRVVDPYDHTAEFDAKDISDNKVVAMLVYLMGTIGIIIALLASSSSPYAAFHVRQALKFTVLNILAGIVMLIFFWTVVIPIAGALFMLVLWVCRIIAFFSICKGNAKEPYIVRSFNFLR